MIQPIQKNSPGTSSASFHWQTMWGCAMTLVALSQGCYDRAALLESARSIAIEKRLVEITLGTFRTTMPRDPATSARTAIEITLFGNVPRHHVKEIEERLEQEEYRLRHETIAVLRGLEPEMLTDPELSDLRKQLASVVKQVLPEMPIKSIGLRDLRLKPQ